MNDSAWFRPKRFGYGVTPVGWRGWGFLVVMVAVLALIGTILLPDHSTYYVIGVLLWLAMFITVSVAKSKGAWRWRWGERDTGDR